MAEEDEYESKNISRTDFEGDEPDGEFYGDENGPEGDFTLTPEGVQAFRKLVEDGFYGDQNTSEEDFKTEREVPDDFYGGQEPSGEDFEAEREAPDDFYGDREPSNGDFEPRDDVDEVLDGGWYGDESGSDDFEADIPEDVEDDIERLAS